MTKTQAPNITKQRLQEYAKDDEWIRSYLHQAEIGHIATHWEEQPFITPSTFIYDEKEHCIIFHSNIVGRIRSNSEKYPEVCFETSHYGRFLPSNIALEFSMQYECVIAFGKIQIIEDTDEKRIALYALLKKYFADKQAGKDYRPITEKELKRTSVYKIKIENWSGKRNWEEEAEQSDEWQPQSN
ncbi:MAG: pyridoxamine 5'-phosphate oxidase family protein [Anaerolineales bacterium]|uniref:Pyridoxamine 5'-phosphate oxidase family protein n=1 Tax=Candidatus Desulfolinea nitratireducens TaxID=2841698 RepID=A0A8J6TIQ2_9CHLR|nr:pyridoxamine 5'-phosphate oxidase family protein [Candidatus Desulfolinea nitratireducens]MBL6960367.1 pyridoxamine 5'-phosphate oxidase family protein [Anaerolineales bacterium]